MPLSTPSSAHNRITIEIEGKVNDLVDDINKLEREIDEFAKANREAEKQSGLTAKSAVSGWTEFRSMYSTVLDVIRVGQQVWNATAQEYINYGHEVEKVARLTGLQAEEASRLIQISDDVRISQQSLNSALTIGAKKYDVSIDGLARMSDQYKSLGTATEKAKFASERFGRNYTEIVKLLEKGGDEIRKMAKETPEGLILDDEDLRRIKEYDRALDELNDSFGALKMQVGEELVPVMADFITNILHLDEVRERRNKFLAEGMSLTEANLAATQELKHELYGEADASEAASDGLEDLADAEAEAEKAARLLSQALQANLSNMFAINAQNEKFADSMESFADKEAELLEERKRVEYDLYQARQEQSVQQAQLNKQSAEAETRKEREAIKTRALADANKFLTDTEVDYFRKLQDIDEQLAQLEEDKAAAIEDDKRASAQRIYDLVQQRLAADGLIDSGEFEYLQDLAVAKGLVTQANADAAVAASQEADALVAAFNRTQGPMDTALSTMQEISSYDGRVVQFGVNFTTTGGISTPTYGSTSGGGSPMYIPPVVRDSGGAGMAGTPYLIGTGAQPEVFVPETNGTFYPQGKGLGNTYNVTVINPKRETAENSIRAALKNLSFLGVINDER